MYVNLLLFSRTYELKNLKLYMVGHTLAPEMFSFYENKIHLSFISATILSMYRSIMVEKKK